MTLASRTLRAQRGPRSLSWPSKGPFEVLDYALVWSDRFEDQQPEVIASSMWTIPAGIIRDSDSFDGSLTTIWLRGGTLGKTYFIENRILTSWGRTFDQTVRLQVIQP